MGEKQTGEKISSNMRSQSMMFLTKRFSRLPDYRGDGDYDNDVVKYDIMAMEMIMMSMAMVMFITEWSCRLPDHRGDGDRSVNRVRNLAPVVNFISKEFRIIFVAQRIAPWR